MNLNKEQITNLIEVSPNTWRQYSTKKKEELLNRKGYNLIGTYKVGREVFYQVEPKGEELVEVINFLKEKGLPVREQPMKFIEFLIELDANGKVQTSALSQSLGVSERTLRNWRSSLEKANLISYDEKAVPAKFKDRKRELISEEEWEVYAKEIKRLREGGLSRADAYGYMRNKTGYIYRRVGESHSNGFYEDFFYLLQSASNELKN